MEFRYSALMLSGICVLIFIFQIIPGFTELFVLDQDKYLQVWRYLSAIFLHGGIVHLMYNLLALVLFGSILEKFIGSKRFLLVFFVSGVLANIISINFYSSSLGASGAIFGVIGALVIVRPWMTVWAFNLPMPMIVAGILWAIGDLIGAVAFLSGNALSNTGNIAHLSGMLFGIILGFIYKKPFSEEKNRKLVIDEKSIRTWEDNYLR
ncbi:MAG: rhomboid family intramembrane serine protease [Nanoarchaeota archaeon]